MGPKYVHILSSGCQLGLMHLQHPRCIYWYGSGFGDHHVEWLDEPTVIEGTQVIHDLEQKVLELRREGTTNFPYIYYEDLEIE